MRAYDSRLTWLLATVLALLAAGIGVIDVVQRIAPVPLGIAPPAVLVLVLLLFIDDAPMPHFWLVRDVPRIVWAALVSAAALAAVVVLVVRLTHTVGDTPDQTAHLLQALLCLGVAAVAALSAYIQVQWARDSLITHPWHSLTASPASSTTTTPQTASWTPPPALPPSTSVSAATAGAQTPAGTNAREMTVVFALGATDSPLD